MRLRLRCCALVCVCVCQSKARRARVHLRERTRTRKHCERRFLSHTHTRTHTNTHSAPHQRQCREDRLTALQLSATRANSPSILGKLRVSRESRMRSIDRFLSAPSTTANSDKCAGAQTAAGGQRASERARARPSQLSETERQTHYYETTKPTTQKHTQLAQQSDRNTSNNIILIETCAAS